MRSVPYAEADAIVTLFTQRFGVVAALARRARVFRKGAPLCLEPIHTLRVELAESPSSELLALRASSLETPRRRLTEDLSRMEAAGLALRWLRLGLPPRTSEPEAWAELVGLLDSLDVACLAAPAAALVAGFGLRLLRLLGYELSLHACVVCGKPCDPDRSSHVDPVRGGIVCRACGGHGAVLAGAVRARLAAATASADALVQEGDVAEVRVLIDDVLRAHLGVGGER